MTNSPSVKTPPRSRERKEKPIKQVKEITVLEWYSEENGRVYLNWELPNGERIVRLTPYKENPIIEVTWGKL